ncbi:MAG: hypothetical protein GX622_04925, partial [Bacteroidales bacterium]|nr:hypothetical protein [Bacteroidales bacterium]
NTQGITTVDTLVYIQGIITLTPELGNIPAFVAYIQDSTAGICLTVTGNNTFSRDSEVKIMCRGVSFTTYNGLLQFGDISIADQTTLVSLTPPALEPETVTISDILSGDFQSQYVKIEDVQFDKPGTYSGEKILTDCSDELEVYTRSEATFSSETLPTGNGYIKGVVSEFNGVQLLLRDNTEHGMTGERCGGAGTVYLTEDFSTLVKYADVSTLTGWMTYPQAGTKTWYGNEVNTRRWVQATAHNSGEASVITWMIAPVFDLTMGTQPYLEFESADGYDNGATMKLLVSTDYDGSATPWNFTWTEKNYNLPASTSSGYSQFASSGEIDLSAYTGGQVWIAWVYDGDSNRTTTWEVDNILVAEK